MYIVQEKMYTVFSKTEPADAGHTDGLLTGHLESAGARLT